jgi:Holliday junction resolvase RusA-like endonuclease
MEQVEKGVSESHGVYIGSAGETYIAFEVPVEPVPKARPRYGLRGRMYTPRRTAVFEKMVAVYALSACLREGKGVLTEPVWVAIVARGLRRNADLDNVIKSVLDAMRGIVYVDDKLVRGIYARAEEQGCGVSVRVGLVKQNGSGDAERDCGFGS